MKMKNVIIFFSGLLKDSNTWDLTESGKAINIMKTAKTKADVITINITFEQYLQPIEETCKDINNKIEALIVDKNVIIVAHSFGAFFAFGYSEYCHKNLTGVILIDPTCKLDSYKSYLVEKTNIVENDDKYKVRKYWLENFESLPALPKYKPKVKVIVHIPIKENKNIDKVMFFEKAVALNMQSQIVVHPNKSHMLHYQMSDRFIHIINILIK
jgi:pimeloyl-ACP methyl ester carboxylesterase